MFGEPLDVLLVLPFSFLRELVFSRHHLTVIYERRGVPGEVFVICAAGIDQPHRLPKRKHDGPPRRVGFADCPIGTGGEV